jgi:signal transduction histidine kinase
MRQFVGTSLKTRLYLLVSLAFIPITLLIFYVAEEQKAAEEEAIFQKTMALARAAANEEDQKLESTRNLLTVVAHIVVIAEGQPDKLSGLLVDLSMQSKAYESFGILNLDGRLVASSDPSRTDHGYSHKAWFSNVLRDKKMVMGQYHGAHINGEPVLYVAVPALDHRRQIVAVAFAALNLNWINRTIFKQLAELPEGSRLTLLDNNQGVLSYDVDAGQWSVPQNFNPALRREMAGRQSGTLSASDENGVQQIYAFAPLASTFRDRRVSIVLEIPEELALAASRRIFTRNVALLVVSALIALLSIWWASDVFILRRVRAMVRASRQLAAGDLSSRIGKIGVRDELSHLAGAFDEMAASLQERIAREAQVMASLAQSREQLRNLAAYQQDVREQERIRIAREIHDQLGQSLTIMSMDLTWIKKHMPKRSLTIDEKISGMLTVIDDALVRLHTVTAELRPVILDDFGLAAAIEWQVEEYSHRIGIDCRMVPTGFEPELPKGQATALFRIFQEILTNIMRHAQAKNVEVKLAAGNGDLILQVRDDGRGITESEVNDPEAFGLLGIRERLYPFGGQVVFDGRPGLGTLVTVRLPISPKGDNQ